MTYGEAKAHLLKRRNRDESHAETDEYHDKSEIARNVVLLSFAENLERIANSLSVIAEQSGETP